MIYDELDTALENLKKSLQSLRKTGIALAEAERNYKIALRKRVLELKERKTPVTIINLIIYGEEDIANLRRDRDIAESVYKANQEAINCYKLEIKIIENQLAREWSNNEILS